MFLTALVILILFLLLTGTLGLFLWLLMTPQQIQEWRVWWARLTYRPKKHK